MPLSKNLFADVYDSPLELCDGEFGHMRDGVVAIDRAGLSAADWEVVRQITVEHMRHRLHMRNALFSHPLPESRLEEIIAGDIEPLRFDYDQAETYVASHAVAAE